MKKKKNYIFEIARWAGRILSVLMIMLMIAFVVDEGLPKLFKFQPPDLIMFLAFFIILTGYLWVWKNEKIGSILINSGTVFFWAIYTVATGNLWMGWFIFVFPITSAPFIYIWWKEK